MVIVACASVGVEAAKEKIRTTVDTITAINKILSKYKLQISDKPVQQPPASTELDTQIESKPANPSNSTEATFVFSSKQVSATFECQLDGGGFSPCVSPKKYTGLADASHTFEVRANDMAGNTDHTPAFFTWTIITAAPTPSSTPTLTSTAAPIASSTPVSVASLPGKTLQQSSCRYAPSEHHLYKTGFKPQAPVKIIGRDADGDWLQIELGGGNTPCWINASLVQVEGDVMALPDTYPIDRRLPISDAFPQITLISASPGAGGVTASWVHFEIREDLKQTDAVEYVIEVWTCVGGKPAFYAVGTNDTFASFQIDNSCGVASHAQLIGQDEHGFSFPTNIPLP